MISPHVDVLCRFKAEDAEEDAQNCIKAVEADMDSLLLVLDNEDPELSELVIYTLRSYVALFKENCIEEVSFVVSTAVSLSTSNYSNFFT